MNQRKLNRLSGYDYSQNGYYFVTVCTHDRQEWFGKIKGGKIVLNECGNIVLRCWDDLQNHYINIKLDEFIVMPNHVHGIIIIENIVGNGFKPFPRNGYKPFPTGHDLSEIVRGLKTFSSRRINEMTKNDIKFCWQKSFYDRIIRDEKSLHEVRKYIQKNPLKWELDEENLNKK